MFTDPIAVCSRSFSRNPILRAELEAHFVNVRYNDSGASLNADDLKTFLHGISGAIVGLESITEGVINCLPCLKVISKYGVGTDNIDIDALHREKIKFEWEGGVNSRAVAELAFAYAILCLRGAFRSANDVAQGKWRQIVGRELREVKIGIVGFGHVGKLLANMVCDYVDFLYICEIDPKARFGNPSNSQFVSLDHLVKNSDCVTLHIPFNKTNEKLFDASLISKMKPGSNLVNTARKGLVDEDALANKILQGAVSGAAFDVLDSEPEVSSPLINLPNVFVSSHIGGSSSQSILNMGRAAIQGLVRGFAT